MNIVMRILAVIAIIVAIGQMVSMAHGQWLSHDSSTRGLPSRERGLLST